MESGALDKLGPNRAQLFASISTAQKYAQQVREDQNSGQEDLFAGLNDPATTPNFIQCKK